MVTNMEKTTNSGSTSNDALGQRESRSARFERPSVEEVSLCCEISAYAPDGDDRPLF